MGAILATGNGQRATGNMGRWDHVRDALNRLPRGWCGYYSSGFYHVADRAIEALAYDHLRNFLARRHKMPARAIELSTMTAVLGELGVPGLRHCK